MTKEKTLNEKLIDLEINKLSIQIALCRYDLEECIELGIPLEKCYNVTQELGRLLVNRSALKNGRYEDLAEYNRKGIFT